jgi:PKD repeat protein
MAFQRTGKILLFVLILSSMGLAGTLPATFFGMHINHSNTPWPSVGFGSFRVWDAGASWTTINTSNGVYNWAPLDAWVAKAQANGVEVTYTFGRTPAWASSNPSNTSCGYGPGECEPPSNNAYFSEFVTALVTRYKGKIKYYEMWNEPNYSAMWQGTTAQLVTLTSIAANIIHSIDPNAKVVSPGSAWVTTTTWEFLDTYLSAGAGPYLDDIALHIYTNNNNAESALSIIDNNQSTENSHGLSLPLIITEGGWGYNTAIPDSDAQAAFLVQRYLLITSRPEVESFFWYQWDNPTWGTLWDSTNGIHKAGVAYGQLTSWLIGSSAEGCSKNASSTWTCSYILANGNAALAVWNATASVSYTPGSQYTQVRAIDGSSASINGDNPYTIGSKPVLFTSASTSSVAAPSATLSVTPGTGVAPVAVSASVSASVPSGVTVKSISIAFGDGTTVNAATGSHTYASAGTYTVQATVTDSLNRTATSSNAVTVTPAQPPQAALSVSPATGKVPLAVTASSAASTDPGGSITSSSINFGDGTVVSGTTVAHTYTTVGTYTVTTTVQNNLGLSSTATATVTAAASLPPIAKLALSQNGMTVTASTAGSYDPDGTIASTVIKWGDGTSTNAASGSHTYAVSGTYTVTATVTDNSGASSSATQSIIIPTINKPPVAVMTLTQTADVSYKVSTTGSYDPDGTIVSTVINWGDGKTTAATSGSHTYSTPGTYTVTVTVTDNDGATASTSRSSTASWGIFIASPKSASTLGSPVQFVASVACPYGIKSTKILVDGKIAYSGTSWLINTYVTMASGTRNIVVLATGKSGLKYQSSFSITVQ